MSNLGIDEQDVAALLAAGAAIGEVRKSPLPDGKPFVIVPTDYEVRTVDDTFEYPPRAIGTVKMRDAASFIQYFNRQKRPCSLIYAQLDPVRILGVIDDHLAEADAEKDLDDCANWRAYRVEFAVPLSREWKLWTKTDRERLDQLQFASLIEDNLPDIINPDGSTMLQISLNFEASKEGSFVSAARLDNGSQALVWKEDVNATGNKITMPQTMTLKIPVFENGPLFEIEARIKYRIGNGKLSIWYELVRPHKVIDVAFREVWLDIEKQTERTLLLGSPE